VPDRPDSQGSQTGVPLNFVVPAPAILSAGATSPAAVPAASGRTDRDSTSDPVPGIWPPSPRNGVGLEDNEDEAVQAGILAPEANLDEARLWQRASDACFADSPDRSWLGEAGDTPWAGTNLGRSPDAAAAVAALAFLGGSWTARRVDSQRRRRGCPG
jgi:hypothetical protein